MRIHELSGTSDMSIDRISPQYGQCDAQQRPPYHQLSQVIGMPRQRPQASVDELAPMARVILELEFLLDRGVMRTKHIGKRQEETK